VFFSEIFLGILESRSNLAITYHQKLALLKSINKICGDPQTLVEIYLNYDCDPDALDNTFERIVNILSKTLTSPDIKLIQAAPPLPPGAEVSLELMNILTNNPVNTMTMVAPGVPTLAALGARLQADKSTVSVGSESSQVYSVVATAPTMVNLPPEKDTSLKFRSLECLVTILRSKVLWSRSYGEGLVHELANSLNQVTDNRFGPSPGFDEDGGLMNHGNKSFMTQPSTSTPAVDDLNRFETAKHQKQALKEGIKLFNYKYKKGINYLIENRVMEKTPKDIAQFLLRTPGLDKKMIGEYLGEGEEFNISVMHAFVDLMDFNSLPFVSALRQFLQTFRLPGEAQKIDRFMLKFAERYILSNADIFANADCAYVLAYSVIMLNTDLHNPQIKKRMKKEEFIKNNRGINDGKSLPEELLTAIYDEILTNEIKMKDEHEKRAKPSQSNSEFGGFKVNNIRNSPDC
jgi:brefeldin A-inhibited guanine nucleotide-exchange protein